MERKTKPVRVGRIKRYIETPQMVVVVEVPVIHATEDPEEPLLEAKTLKFLDEAKRRAEAGDRKWLRKVGRVFERGVA
jgi:ribosomal protein L18E